MRIARNTLSARLRLLVAGGILDRRKYQERPARYEYSLSKKGEDLYPVFLALLRWGDRWMSAEEGLPLLLTHTKCGRATKPIIICSCCGDVIKAQEVEYRSGPGAAGTSSRAMINSRRRSFDRGNKVRKACSIDRTLALVGDRWTFLVLRESFFGVRRFEDFQRNLGIARNLLTDRLKLLVAHGILERQKYQERPDRFAYRLTEKGLDLYAAPLALMRWGDTWLSDKEGPPLALFHKTCGRKFHAIFACSHCKRELKSADVKYMPGPGSIE